MRKLPTTVFLLLLFANCPAQMVRNKKIQTLVANLFETYCNRRFEYCIQYPDTVMFPQPESHNGDGIVFNNKNGSEVLRVWGVRGSDVDGERISLQQVYKEDLKRWMNAKEHKSVTYKRLSKTSYVISGYDGNHIYYQKTITKPDGFAYAVMRYRKEEKNRFDSVASKLFRSFH